MYVKYVHKNVYAPVSPIEFKIGRLCGVFVQSATSAYVDIHVSHKTWPPSVNELWAPIRQG